MTNNLGKVTNQYTYDPFGGIIEKTENVKNMFLYNGKWGVRALFGFDDIYIMRSRMYHAKYGRFMDLPEKVPIFTAMYQITLFQVSNLSKYFTKNLSLHKR